MATRYETLADLRDAYERKELTGDDEMMLDNDQACVYVGDEKVWEEHPVALLGEALTLLGIPWDIRLILK